VSPADDFCIATWLSLAPTPSRPRHCACGMQKCPPLMRGASLAPGGHPRRTALADIIQRACVDRPAALGSASPEAGEHDRTSGGTRRRLEPLPRAARRQDIYLQALQQHCSRVEIRRGTYEEKTRQCARCGARVGFQTEKQTDVNLAVEMMLEAAKPEGHRAEVHLLVTGDTDLLPAVRAVRSRGIEVVAIAPPARARARGATR